MSIHVLQEMLDQSNNVVFFGGAGVSTESGLPDFRSKNGLYSERYDYPPEIMLSHNFFMRQPEAFYAFYLEKLLCSGIKPNAAHLKLAELEQSGKLSAVLTQNIDGLHQMAGSKNVLELHGSVHRNYCLNCGQNYDMAFMQNSSGIPRCACGGIIRPDIVLYQEPLDERVLRDAIRAISTADMLIVGGTSLAVYPAAGLIEKYRGNKLVLINQSPTPYDERADLLLCGKIGEALGQIIV